MEGQHTLFSEGDPQVFFRRDDTVSDTSLQLATTAHSCAAMVGQEATCSVAMGVTVEHARPVDTYPWGACKSASVPALQVSGSDLAAQLPEPGWWRRGGEAGLQGAW